MARMGGSRVGLLLMGVLLMGVAFAAAAAGTPPATFVLGDSLVDAGNNDYFFTLAKADHVPYGIDRSDGRATGRFCNGKIIPDLVSDFLGTPYPLPVLDPQCKGANLLRGVNYASAGAGILEDTGSIFIGRLTMSRQFELFGETKAQIAQLIGQAAADDLIANAVYSFTVGGNDYINNYLAITSNRKNQYTPPQYEELLIQTFRGQLQTAYGLGMRKITISNIGPIGCAPSILSSRSVNGECVAEVNGYATGFNAALKAMLDGLRGELPGATLVYINAFDVVKEFIDNPTNYGFTDPVTTACCGIGKYNGIDGGCREPLTNLCDDRSLSVFWDAFHPTEKVNRLAQSRFLDGGLDVVEPINLRQLFAM